MRGLRGIVTAAVCAAGFLGMAGLSGCETHKEIPTMLAHVDMPSLREVGLQQVWQQSLKMAPGERVKKSWRVGVSVYVATSDSRLIRMNATTGEVKWAVGLGTENFEIFRPIELRDPNDPARPDVVVVTRSEVFLLDAETGDAVQPKATLGMSVSADPVVIGNTLCVGGADIFYGVYLDHPELKHWRVPAPGDVFDSAPVVLDGNVLVASRSGRLWRISADSGDWDWKDRKTNGGVSAGMAVDFSAIYVPGMDQQVYAFRSDTGGQLWDQRVDGRLDTVPALAGPHVLIISRENGLYALLRTSGAIKWHAEDVAQIATVEDNGIWVGDNAGYLRNLDSETGEQRAKASVPNVQIFVRNAVDKNLILVGYDGTVAVYKRPVK